MRRRPKDNRQWRFLVEPGVAAAVVVVCGCVGRRSPEVPGCVVFFRPACKQGVVEGETPRLRLYFSAHFYFIFIFYFFFRLFWSSCFFCLVMTKKIIT